MLPFLSIGKLFPIRSVPIGPLEKYYKKKWKPIWSLFNNNVRDVKDNFNASSLVYPKTREPSKKEDTHTHTRKRRRNNFFKVSKVFHQQITTQNGEGIKNLFFFMVSDRQDKKEKQSNRCFQFIGIGQLNKEKVYSSNGFWFMKQTLYVLDSTYEMFGAVNKSQIIRMFVYSPSTVTGTAKRSANNMTLSKCFNCSCRSSITCSNWNAEKNQKKKQKERTITTLLLLNVYLGSKCTAKENQKETPHFHSTEVLPNK